MSITRLAAIAAATSLVAASLTTSALAATITWDGGTAGTGNNWNTAANWNPDGTPGGTDIAAFSSAGTSTNLNYNIANGASQAVGTIVQQGATDRFIGTTGGSTGTPFTGTITLNGVVGGISGVGTETYLLQNTSSGLLQLGSYTNNTTIVAIPTSGIFDVQSTGLLTISARMSGAGRITKTGSGRAVFSNTNSSNTGGVQINGGQLDFGSTSSITTTAGGATVANQLGIAGGGIFNYTSTISAASLGTTIGVEVGSGGGTISIANSTTVFTVNGAVSGAGRLTKAGPGRLVLTSLSNTNTGGVQIDAGQLDFASTSSFATTAGGATVANQLGIANGAIFTYTNTVAAATLGSTVGVEIGSGGGTIGVANATTNLTFNGAVSGTGRITKTGPGTLTLASGSSGYSGGLNITGGTVSTAFFVGAGTAPASLISDYLRLDGGTFAWTATGTNTFGSTRGITIGANGGTFSVSGSGATLGVNGPIVGEASTSGSLTKIGGTTLRLNGTNTYAGATNVSAGTLRVNGTHTSAGDYLVSAGATLGGSGQITLATGKTVAVAGTLSPGGSGTITTPGATYLISTLTINGGDVILQQGGAFGSLAIDVDPASTSNPQIDVIVTNGNLDISGSTLSLNFLSTDSFAAPLVFATYGSRTGTFANEAAVNTAGYQILYGYNGNNLALAPIPEPTSLAAFGIIGLIALRRRN